MTTDTAARLAHRLMQVHRESVNFFFELDTADNASLVADHLRTLGCGVLLDTHDFRLNVFMPIDYAKKAVRPRIPDGPLMWREAGAN